MDTQKNLDGNTKITLSQKLIPLNLILFFIFPAIFFWKEIYSLTIHYIFKIPLYYIGCITVPLLIFYLVTCTTIILDDIFDKKPLDNISSYYL